jgi:XPA protein C-terminus/Restriction endonuclease
VAAAETDEQTLRHVLADLQRNGSLRKSGDTAFKPTGSLSTRGWPCCECGTRTRSVDVFHDKPLCAKCRSQLPQKYGCITKTRALREFRLREHELYRLTYIERDNPHYKRASPMHLFLLSQVQDLAKSKWGSDEPYLISLTEVSPDQLRWLEEDPERLKQFTPERFELLLADRFEAMGLCVQLIGRTNEPDGGIDLIAYPDPHSNQPKYLLAVQAEHHRTDRKTGAPKVQKFVGAM